MTSEDYLRQELAKAHQTIQLLQEKNARLTNRLEIMLGQNDDLPAGFYIVTPEGDWNGPCRSIFELEKDVPDYIEDGGTCTAVEVIRRYTEDDFYELRGDLIQYEDEYYSPNELRRVA